MAQLIVRNIEESVKERLQHLAAEHGHSMEEEVRNILRDAVKDENLTRKGLGTAIADRFKDIELEEDIPELRGFEIEPPKFD